MNNTLVSVNFNNQTLLATLVNDVPYVALKPICENLGLDWQSQMKRIERHPVLKSTKVIMTLVAQDGKLREMLMLPLKMLNGWLFGIDSTRVKSEIKDTVIKYQEECFEVLANHFMPKPYGLKELPPAYLSHDMKRHIQELVNEQKIKTGKNHNTIYHDLKTHFQTSTYAEIPITKYGDVCAWFGAKPKYELPQMVSIDVKELEALRALPSPAKSGELIDDEVTHIKYKTGRVLSVGEFIQETKENPLSSWCLVHKDWLKKLKDATTVLV